MKQLIFLRQRFLVGLLFMAGVLLLLTGRSSALQQNATWDGGTGNWNVGTNWTPDTVPNNGANTYNVFIDGGNLINSSVYLNMSATIDNLTIDSGESLSINNSMSLTVSGGGTITNNGAMSLNSTGSWTTLYLSSGNVAFTGNGTLTLGNNNANRIWGVSGASLTNTSGHTIQGSGALGYGYIGLTNAGTVTANQSTPLVIDPDSSGANNTGVMEADGGTLRLQSGTFGNTGTIRAVNGSSVELSTATVNNTGGTIQTLDTSTVDMTGGNTITGGTINGKLRNTSGTSTLNYISFTNSATFEGLNSTTTNLAGTITNNGAMSLNSTGAYTSLYLSSGNVAFTGAGTLTLGNDSANRILGASGTSLTNASGHTIQGSGQLGYGAIALTNAGTVTANQSTPLVIDPDSSGANNTGVMEADGGTLRLQSGTFGNTGTIRAVNGSSVELSTATVNNTGGTIQTVDTSTVDMTGGSTITGGTVNGRLRNTSGTSTLNNVSFTNSATFEGLNSTTTNLAGTITNNGAMSLNSTGAYTSLYLSSGNVTLTGAGTLTLGNDSANRILGASGTSLTNASGHTIQGSGELGYNSIGLTNPGTIRANQSTPLTINPSNSGFTNSGTLKANSGSTLNVTDTLTNLSGTTLTGGTYNVAGTMKLPGNINTNAANIVLDGTASQLLNYSGGTNALTNLATNAASGSFSLLNDRDFTTAGNLANAGAITVGNNSILKINGTGTGTLTSSGTISGPGEIQGNVVSSGGASPGSSPGILTITGNYTQNVPGYLLIEIAGLIPGTEYDRLDISGTATLGGTLDVNLLNGFTPAYGNSFTILEAGNGINGAFDTLDLPALSGGLGWQVAYSPTNVTLNVAPEPMSMLLVGLGLAGLPFLRRFRGVIGKPS